MKFLKNIVINFFLLVEYKIFFKKFENFLQKTSIENQKNLIKKHKEGFEELKEFVNNNFQLKNFKERFFFDLTLKTQTVLKDQKLSFIHGYLLQHELRKYLILNNSEKNINILEIGTARGYSSICMADVLEELNTNGKILSLDILPINKKIFWNCIDDINYGKQTRYELLKSWEYLINKYLIFINGYTRIVLRKLYFPRINFCFIDGSHDYDDVKYEIQYITKRQRKNDVIFFDDYNIKKFPGVVKAINKFLSKKEYTHKLLDYGAERKYLVAIKK